MDLKELYKKEKGLEVDVEMGGCSVLYYSEEYVEWLEKRIEQLTLTDVSKSLPVDRETALKVREDIINEHYKDDPNKNTFGLAFITCYDWLAKLCNE